MIDERARHELYRAAEKLLGTETADTLMSLLPPVGWADVATKTDLHQLEVHLDARFAHAEARVDARFAHAEARVNARFAVVDARFENVEARVARVDARVSQFESRLDRSLRGQTRTLMLGLVGGLFTMTWLCLGTVALAT